MDANPLRPIKAMQSKATGRGILIKRAQDAERNE